MEKTERSTPNRSENAMMIDLMVVLNSIAAHGDACNERLKGYKWWRRDRGLLISLITRIQVEMLKTMPNKRIEYYRTLAMHGRITVDIPGPVRLPRSILITDQHAAALTEAAMRSECLLCVLDGREVKRCPLREALLEIAPPTKVGSLFDGCEYRGAAGQLIQGEDVTI